MEERVREHAYYLWQIAGCPDGNSVEFWYQAASDVEREEGESRAEHIIMLDHEVAHASSSPA
ncbi:MAG TPA: DUF2934 domain-containing protein [Acidiphilium sp.]|nr:DUF2934 domain-containing protein [Acidiphilium sp.]HQU25369.1 DUF2934 domain-containing protein [Acidiphilium sp.]